MNRSNAACYSGDRRYSVLSKKGKMEKTDLRNDCITNDILSDFSVYIASSDDLSEPVKPQYVSFLYLLYKKYGMF